MVVKGVNIVSFAIVILNSFQNPNTVDVEDPETPPKADQPLAESSG